MGKVIFILIILFQLQASAQQDVYVGGQLDAGIAGKTTFDDKSLDKKNLSPHFGGLLFVNYRLFDAVSIEIGIGQHWNNTRFKDPSFEKENEGFSLEMNNKNYFWNYYVALSGFYRIGTTETYLYGKLGYSFNVYGNKTLTNAKPFEISRLAINKTISSTISYVSSNQSLMPEIGIQQKLLNDNLISVGLKMNFGRTAALNGNYTITDNITGEATVDKFSSLGNFTTLTFRYNVLLHHIDKKEKVKRTPKIKKEKVKDESSETKQDPKPKPKKEVPTEVAGRELIVIEKLKVHSAKVTVFVWDHQTVDGDRISLNLNGKWILEDYTLKKEKHSFEIELEEGVNTFVLHALNLGKYKPNTAALIVKEGVKSHKVILESDLNESGTLEINYKKK